MKQLEKFAREICWIGFSADYRKSIGFTKAQYWKQLSESTRKNYEYEALRFMFLLGRLPPEMVRSVHDDARMRSHKPDQRQ